MATLAGDNSLSPLARELVEGPAIPATLRELDRGGVDSIDVPSLEALSSNERLEEILWGGARALQENGLPDPDLDKYSAAMGVASASGEPLGKVLEEFEAVMPQELRVPQQSAGESFSITPSADTTVAPEGMEVASLQGVEPQKYQEYDVHFMMYPLGHNIGGMGIETRPSHGFIVVTEKGVNPLTLNEESLEALIVTRGGPDDGKYDGRFDTNVQSPTESNRDGDVYVMDHFDSLNDLSKGGIRVIETTTITGDIDDIRANVQDFRQAVNSTDINYHAPYQNSNTYAGDVYQNLTGNDAPDTIQWPHYMPGLGNDLPVEGDYSYHPTEAEAGSDVGL